ncbi:hypothetical protein BDA99DRAFT_544654 [Phascolomyces articulosus]|uniref:Uncharacterized protein n=1 Tax=Phascolomyces articulosus TaxID=60185 RepID=A0AAD5JUT4_9FUNG|nr:hypothetical protein BDA99DRAFT_544654 [Phascolomyces articulosus]
MNILKETIMMSYKICIIKALFSVISEIEVEALPSYTSQVLDRLKKERADSKLSDELSAFIDQKLVEKEDLEKRIADQIYDEHKESVKGHLFEYRFQKAVTAMKREEYKKEKGEIEEKLGYWIAVANDFKRNAGSNSFLVEHKTIIELLQEKLHNYEYELAKYHYDDYYRQ